MQWGNRTGYTQLFVSARELSSRLGLSEGSGDHGVLHTLGCVKVWVDSQSRWTEQHTNNTQKVFRALQLAKNLHISDLLLTS